MKQTSVINRTGPEKRERPARIELKRRPRIGFGPGQLDAVSARLSSSELERERFLNNPQSYLREQRIHIPAGCLATLSAKDSQRDVGVAVVAHNYAETRIASLVAGVTDKRLSPADASLLMTRGLL
jgi:hypothetical protein